MAHGHSALAQDVDSALLCSTTEQAEVVIAGAGGQSPLVAAVSQSVPSDPLNCGPSYCRASEDEERSVQVAVGAGLSDAFSNLTGEARDEEAARLLEGSCSSCNEVVLTAFAASQGTTVTGLCETSQGGAGGSTPSELVIGVTGGGGGQLPSGN